MKNTIEIFSIAGDFAHNKDKASNLRKTTIIPLLKDQGEVVIDFQNVDLTTQSFIHALISEPIRLFGVEVLDRIVFKNCNETVRTLIEIVVDYMQVEDTCVPQKQELFPQ